MSTTLIPDSLLSPDACVMTYDPADFKPAPRKAPDVVRESDGRTPLVGYLGWKTILERLAHRSA